MARGLMGAVQSYDRMIDRGIGDAVAMEQAQETAAKQDEMAEKQESVSLASAGMMAGAVLGGGIPGAIIGGGLGYALGELL